MALPQILAFRSIGVMENWSIEKRICGFKVFPEISLSNASIGYDEVLLFLHQSNTPLLHTLLKFQETNPLWG